MLVNDKKNKDKPKISFFKKIKFKYWWFRETIYWPTRQYLKNIYKFRKELANFYDWNYDLGFLRRTIELNHKHISKFGYEEETSKHKKLMKMERAIFLLKAFEADEFIEFAEKELNLKYVYREFNFEPVPEHNGYHRLINDLTDDEENINSLIRHKSIEIEKNMWKELWTIIQGQEEGDSYDENKFDGSGLTGWWN